MEDIKNMPKDEKYEKFLETMIWYFSRKETPTGFYKAVGRIATQLENLNANLKQADESSTKLTRALNELTKWGVIIAGLGVFVAFTALLFDIYKYLTN